MYLSATNESLEIVLSGGITTNQLEWIASFQDVTSIGVSLTQSSSQGVTNNTTTVTMVDSFSPDTRKREIIQIVVYNKDTVDAVVTISKNVGGTKYIILKQTLTPAKTLSWVKSSGWQLI